MSEKKAASTMEALLHQVGEFGRFQKILAAMFFVMNLPISYQVLISYFMTLTPTWVCRNGSTSCLYNTTLSGNDMRRCRIPKTEWHFTEAKTFSVVTDLGIDCGKEWQLSMISSIYFIGWGVGGFCLGYAGDKFGRKFLVFPSVLFTIIMGFLVGFLKDVYLIIIARFLMGFLNPGSLLQSFIIASEYAGPRHRSLAGLLVYLTLPVGYVTVALQAYLTRNWRTLQIICTAPYIITMAFYTFIPRSIKWCQLNNNMDDVTDILRRITFWNKTTLPDDINAYFPNDMEKEKCQPIEAEAEEADEELVSRSLLSSTLVQSCVWFATGTAYFGLSLVASDLGGTSYRDFIILSLIELPALPCAVILCNYIGRKPASIIPLFLGGICTVIVSTIPLTGGMKLARVVVGILGKFGLSITFNAIFTWSVELYPTHVRSIGMGYLQTVSHFGSCAAPWIAIALRRVTPWLPYAVLGTPAIIAAVVGLLLPETKRTTKVYQKDPEKVPNSYQNSGYAASEENKS